MDTGWDGYAARWAALHGGYDPRQASPAVRGWLWIAYRSARVLAAPGIPPSAVTAAGVLFAAAVPAVAAPGGPWPLVCAALVLLGALADTADGALALVSDRETRLGRVYDSVADRLTEAAWLAGFWVLGAPGWLVTLAGAVAWLHEYVRARATTAGMADLGAVTLGERPTRVLLVLFGYAFAGLAGLASAELIAGTVTVATAILALLGGLGLVQLAAAVRRALRDDRGMGAPRGP
jgi:CDP-diacylglycerol--glycerol-3-phosphate 3-phosphatidyltransferase